MQLCTLQIAAERYRNAGLTVETLRRWIQKGALSGYKPGLRLLVDMDELDRLMVTPATSSAK